MKESARRDRRADDGTVAGRRCALGARVQPRRWRCSHSEGPSRANGLPGSSSSESTTAGLVAADSPPGQRRRETADRRARPSRTHLRERARPGEGARRRPRRAEARKNNVDAVRPGPRRRPTRPSSLRRRSRRRPCGNLRSETRGRCRPLMQVDALSCSTATPPCCGSTQSRAVDGAVLPGAGRGCSTPRPTDVTVAVPWQAAARDLSRSPTGLLLVRPAPRCVPTAARGRRTHRSLERRARLQQHPAGVADPAADPPRHGVHRADAGGRRRAGRTRAETERCPRDGHRVCEDLPDAVLGGRGVLPPAPPPRSAAAGPARGRARTAGLRLSQRGPGRLAPRDRARPHRRGRPARRCAELGGRLCGASDVTSEPSVTTVRAPGDPVPRRAVRLLTRECRTPKIG